MAVTYVTDYHSSVIWPKGLERSEFQLGDGDGETWSPFTNTVRPLLSAER
jgi:hypothetical protein